MTASRTPALFGFLAAALVLPPLTGEGGAAERKGPNIRLGHHTGPKATFEVHGLDAAALAKLAKAGWKPDQWTALFGVYVRRGNADDATRPAMLGSYQVKKDVLTFAPRFPLVRGVRYRAVFDPARRPGLAPGARAKVMSEFVLPKPAAVASTVVKQVYPSAKEVPENQLKFYLHFSAPMSQGDVYRHIKLFNALGKAVELPFLELEKELWDADGKRFTLIIDPGRIKRGLKPREDLGPVLEKGKTYTLVIDRHWEDAEGNLLKKTFRKKFKALAPVEKRVDPKQWKLRPPAADSIGALAVVFPRPLDYALLHRWLWVTDAKGRAVQGKVSVSHHETRWHFKPPRAWKAGQYHLEADTRLEDLAGNNIERPFEVDVFRRVERRVKGKTVKVSFQVRPAK
jgi:hypothetical protein